MPYSHHSHSGQFCAHARDTLEAVVEAALGKKMQVFALTEHMPREQQDLYSEEINAGYSEDKLHDIFSDYHAEARRLQALYSPKLSILIGTEVDWIRPSSKGFIENLLSEFQFQLFIGSVHHVHGIPIDYDAKSFEEAQKVSGDSVERLFEDYFDLQYEMLKALTPPIVGHFDLIRLKSEHPNVGFKTLEGVWQRIHRNLVFVVNYGGVLELNSAALRKGLQEPYPNEEISKEFLALGGSFTLSDDSHGIDHIGSSYRELLRFAQEVGITQLTYFEKGTSTKDSRFPNITTQTTALSQVQSHPFFA
ncbi:MAG: hypothetical protein LQ346_007659 [Caloplaca aetnensis]|nr:MAG: hypothetical protein LQ346_007659 [Caloplaca aetnensis]